MSNNIKLFKVKKLNEIKKIVERFDNVFSPALSSRIDDLDEYALKLLNNSFLIAAKKQNEIIGFSAVYANDYDNMTAYLAQIAVIPEFQRCGVGKKLLDECIKLSIKSGMVKLRLEVYKSNIRAIELYEKNGFAVDGISKSKGYIFMTKEL